MFIFTTFIHWNYTQEFYVYFGFWKFYSGLDFTLVLKEVFFHALVLRSLSFKSLFN